MAMQTDVQASVPITGDGQFTDQAANNLSRTRVKASTLCQAVQQEASCLKMGVQAVQPL
jgi:hypothetical protein